MGARVGGLVTMRAIFPLRKVPRRNRRELPRPALLARRSGNRGFTLLEIIIVLGLVVIVTGLALTTIQKPIAGRRLQLAADKIRAEWLRARNRAMASGQIYCFSCELGGRGYVIQPWSETGADGASGGDSLPPLESSAPGDGFSPSETLPPLSPATGLQSTKQLPERINFADLQVTDGDLSGTFSQDIGGMGFLGSAGSPGDLTVSGSSLTAPTGSTIFFFPDGSTSSAVVTLENEYGRRIDISLRGLTGAVLVGEPYNGHEGIASAAPEQGNIP